MQTGVIGPQEQPGAARDVIQGAAVGRSGCFRQAQLSSQIGESASRCAGRFKIVGEWVKKRSLSEVSFVLFVANFFLSACDVIFG